MRTLNLGVEKEIGLANIPVDLDQVAYCVLRPNTQAGIGYCFTSGGWIVHKHADDKMHDEIWEEIRNKTKGRYILYGQLILNPPQVKNIKKSYRGKNGLCLKIVFTSGQEVIMRQKNKETLERQHGQLVELIEKLTKTEPQEA